MGPLFRVAFRARSKPRQIFTMSVFESYWANKAACDDAERAYYEKLSGCKVDGLVSASGSSEDMALVKKLNALEVENKLQSQLQRHQLSPLLRLLRRRRTMLTSLEAPMRRRARRRSGSRRSG